MPAYPTARRLQQAAVDLWPAHLAWDRRSVTYRDADKAGSDGADLSNPPRRAELWVAALHRYEAFWRDQGRRPRERTRNLATLPAQERRMGEWARYQRRTLEQLCRYQLTRLGVSPAFVWDPQEADWQANFEACSRYLRITATLPRLTAADPNTFALARWLGRQLKELQTGRLPVGRANRLDQLLTGRAKTESTATSVTHRRPGAGGR
jgi:hypothetical protein